MRQAVFDDTLRDIAYAARAFRRAPFAAITIVSTVALGLGLVTVAFTMLNALVFRVDAVPDVHEMFAVRRPATASESRGFTRAQFDALRRETAVFTDAYAEVAQVDIRADGRLMFGTFVTGNFFHVVRAGAAMGRVLTPADDVRLAGQPVLVLSHRGWDRLFARDPAIVGRPLVINGLTYEIIGVMPEGFRGLNVTSDDFWAPLSMFGRVRPVHQGRDAEVDVEIVGRLKPGMSWQTARAGLALWDARQTAGLSTEHRNVSNITLAPKDGTVPQPLEAVAIVTPFFFAFGLILLIACANVANLLLARGVARQRELGIQLSLGATRRRIVRLLLTESLLLALVAAAAGFVISRLVLHVTISAVMTTMAADIGDVRLWVPDADWRIVLFLIVGAALSTVVFGLAPALSSARVDPLKTIRGDVGTSARPGRARTFLIGLQVSASALLLISAAVFLRSAVAGANFDSGMRTDDILFVSVASESTREAIVRAVASEPSVAATAAASPNVFRSATVESDSAKAVVAYRLVSPEYFGVFDIPLVRGRGFTPAERTPDAPVAIVSETTARAAWPNGDAIGREIRLALDPESEPSGATPSPRESRTLTVVGVARDVAGLQVARLNKSVVYAPTNGSMPGTTLAVRVNGDPEVVRQTLLDQLTTIDPNMARQLTSFRTLARMDTYFLKLAFWLTVVLGGLALALTLSGLFSVLSYLVEQRTKEIGVRMALGATPREVTGLVLSQSIRPVGVGLLVGGTSAAGLAWLLLATGGAATIGQVVHVFDPVAYAASVFVITAACLAAASIPAARAARVDPTWTLRRE